MTPHRRDRLRLAIVLAVAAWLRLAGLNQVSFFHYDEGEAAKGALGPAVAARWLLKQAWNGEPLTAGSLKAEYVRHGFPYARTAARPGHLALGAVSMTFVGVSDMAMILLSAAAGIGTVLLVFLAVRAMEGEPGVFSFASALILAVSPDHVFFSRTGFAHVPAGFFLALAFYWHVRDRLQTVPVRAFRTGLACGLAFTCHFNVAWILAALFAADVWEAVSGPARPGILAWAARWGKIACGAAVPLLLFQGATLAAGEMFSRWLPDQRTYLADLRAQYAHLFSYCNPHALSTPFFYGIHWIRTEGAVPFAVVLAGSLLALFNRAGPPPVQGFLRTGALLVWIPFLAMSGMSWKVARTLVPLLPFAAILGGFAVAAWRPASAAGKSARVLLLLAGLAQPVWTSCSYSGGHGHFRQIVQELRTEGRPVLAVDELPAVDFYAATRYPVMVRDWATYERIRGTLPGFPVLIALWKDGEYGFQDPVYRNRYDFVRDVTVRMESPTRRAAFRVPLAYDYVDRTFDWSRLLTLSDVRYEVHLFDLGEIPQ